ncbi:MAG TPA: hypothetical protein P5081_24725, partial [Phycisphaerae bacterium]|nr:hypothetical protein [Phycisphaerae bacterium]
MGRFLRDIRRDSNRIPELALFATAELAMEASRRAWRQTWRDRGRLALHFMLVCGVASVFGVLITDGGLWTALAAPESLKSVFVGICNGVGVMLYFRLVVMHGYRRRLREEMVQLGIPICVHCGYDL